MGEEEIPPGDGEGSAERSVRMGEAPETRGDPENSGRVFSSFVTHCMDSRLSLVTNVRHLPRLGHTHTGDGRDCEQDAPPLE